MEEAQALCDHVCIIKSGEKINLGNLSRVRLIKWMKVVLKSLIIPLNRGRRGIRTHRNCFTYIQDQMYQTCE